MDWQQLQPLLFIVGLPALFAYGVCRIPLVRVLVSLGANALFLYLFWIFPGGKLMAGFWAFLVMPFAIVIGAVLVDLSMGGAKKP